jgi:hypothetical protein
MKPNCYECIHRLKIPGDCHSRCNNHKAKVEGHPQGIKSGWFIWPLNFDPTWLLSCNGFSNNPEDKKPIQELDPFIELLAILKR